MLEPKGRGVLGRPAGDDSEDEDTASHSRDMICPRTSDLPGDGIGIFLGRRPDNMNRVDFSKEIGFYAQPRNDRAGRQAASQSFPDHALVCATGSTRWDR